MSAHTKGPYIAQGHIVRQYVGEGVGGRIIADCGPHHTPLSEYPKSCLAEDEANANRIAEALNALEAKTKGFDQAVYDSGYFLSNHEKNIAAHFYAAGKAAGDETKRELLEALEGFGKDFDGSFCFCLLRVGHPGVSDHSKACKKARAAIAKAKKIQP